MSEHAASLMAMILVGISGAEQRFMAMWSMSDAEVILLVLLVGGALLLSSKGGGSAC